MASATFRRRPVARRHPLQLRQEPLAMREPTEAMCDAACGEAACPIDAGDAYVDPGCAERVWQAMVDLILAGRGGPTG
jgi:hypothetical protein